MAMKMRQSLAQLEQEFATEMERDRARRQHLRRAAVIRTRNRHIERQHAKGRTRFWLLVLTLIATALIVTAAMFETLYRLLG
jgi:hypothetical protein